VSHARWLEKRIARAELEVHPSVAHFDAVRSLPGILTWMLKQAGEEPSGGSRGRYDRVPEHVLAAPVR